MLTKLNVSVYDKLLHIHFWLLDVITLHMCNNWIENTSYPMDVKVDIYRSLHIGLYVCKVVKTMLYLSRRYASLRFVLRENEEYIIVVGLELCVENR